MMGKLWTKVGVVLVGGFLLGSGLILAAQPVQAHTLIDPSCSGLPTAADFFIETGAETVPLSAGPTVEDMTVTPKKGTGESGEGRTAHYYAKITVPALTAGELRVSGGTNAPSEAALCRGSSQIASSRPSYATAHNDANMAADAAATAEVAARVTNASESNAKRALRNAATALRNAATALTNLATALRNAGESDTDATTAAGDATTAAGDATTAADTAPSSGNNPASDEARALDLAATALDKAATALDKAATALGAEMVFDPMTALISSGTEEYVVVVTIPADGTIADLTVSFKGVMAIDTDAQSGQDGGSFTQNNQRITHTLMTTSNPGLLTVGTTGSAVDTKGTLNEGANDIAMDDPSGSNFEIVSPVKGSTTYSLHVDGQTRGERGDYGLDMEFGVAENLGSAAEYANTNRDDVMLERGRADYFFFTAPDSAAGYRFLTVETQKHPDVTTETNTTGTLFSQNGLVATDTNSGAGNNFRLSAPISPGDYIVEVKGSSSSTEGEYVLVTTSRQSDSRGSVPDMFTGRTSGTDISAGREVDPYTIDVTTPGTLQVKTTGDTDTVGVLYGPDGRQIATDDNSADGMRNFLITEYVEAGLHLVTVEGQTATTTGDYTLVVNFVEGADIDVGTRPGTGTETEEQLRDRVAELEDDLDACLMPVETDPRGVLENPSGGSFRSGIGIISGWVCAAQEVEVQILRAPGVLVETLTVAHGTSRPDVPENSNCNNENAGFGMTYNFNHLREGEYTIRAFADDELIGDEQTFEVVHLVDFANADLAPFDTNDRDRFLRNLRAAECRVNDFPVTGEDTFLLWEQSTQNFVIEDAG